MLIKELITCILALNLAPLGISGRAETSLFDHFDRKPSILLASTAEANVGAQNAAQSAAQSSAGSSTAASTSPSAPVLSPPSMTLPGYAPLYSSAPSSVPIDSKSFSSTVPNSSTAGSSSSAPVLRDKIKLNSDSENQDNSVESFFQIPSRQGVKSSSDASKRTGRHGASRLIWHVMDNLGVPMFYGNNEPDLDPTLERNYVDPPIPSMGGRKIKDVKSAQTDRVDKTIGFPDPHKTPDRELDGAQISPTSNVQIKQ